MKQVPFAHNYFVTEDGKIFSNKSGETKEINVKVDTSRYKRLGIVNNEGKNKKYLLHRVIAITYLLNPHNLPQINHKDGNKLNNHVDNLEWVTRQQNMAHAFQTGLNSNTGEMNGKAVLREQQVLEIYQELLKGVRTIDLARQYCVDNNIIKKIKYKVTWKEVLEGLPDIDKKHKSKSISDETALWIIKQLSNKIPIKEIIASSTNARITDDIIHDIRRNKSFKHLPRCV